MSNHIGGGAAGTVLSDEEIEAAGAQLYAERRAEARADVAAMCRGWAVEGA